ncbi:hypothetical protein BX661DRAFT_62894 [Kickxella alabastrina]|uniref:uncharacterized protein n=1 Tax=Kickxella alabastrina TaxID=61397 RepID=UPI00221FE0E9|nr:uncharacterized protein BX661DRAFT_62894 [Kickxella alabastrina]KAI7821623.1 hypothetical protein BX661DRAFT_62894 [Kickxella alabastrina]
MFLYRHKFGEWPQPLLSSAVVGPPIGRNAAPKCNKTACFFIIFLVSSQPLLPNSSTPPSPHRVKKTSGYEMDGEELDLKNNNAKLLLGQFFLTIVLFISHAYSTSCMRLALHDVIRIVTLVAAGIPAATSVTANIKAKRLY